MKDFWATPSEHESPTISPAVHSKAHNCPYYLRLTSEPMQALGCDDGDDSAYWARRDLLAMEAEKRNEKRVERLIQSYKEADERKAAREKERHEASQKRKAELRAGREVTSPGYELLFGSVANPKTKKPEAPKKPRAPRVRVAKVVRPGMLSMNDARAYLRSLGKVGSRAGVSLAIKMGRLVADKVDGHWYTTAPELDAYLVRVAESRKAAAKRARDIRSARCRAREGV